MKKSVEFHRFPLPEAHTNKEKKKKGWDLPTKRPRTNDSPQHFLSAIHRSEGKWTNWNGRIKRLDSCVSHIAGSIEITWLIPQYLVEVLQSLAMRWIGSSGRRNLQNISIANRSRYICANSCTTHLINILWGGNSIEWQSGWRRWKCFFEQCGWDVDWSARNGQGFSPSEFHFKRQDIFSWILQKHNMNSWEQIISDK